MKALITGASSGIGEEISYKLANMGYDLILVARDKENLERVAKNIKTKTKVIVCDLAEEKNVRDLYEKTKKENIDILVNNAGFGLFGFFDETDLDRELEMINVNVKAVHILMKLFLKDFVKRDSGYILNVASSAGFLAGPKLNTYYATKNYVLKLTLAVYEELKNKKSNVHISALCPGPVDTNFNKVAKGSFTVKAASPKYVANYAIDKMFNNKLIIIPKLSVRLGVLAGRIMPTKLMLKINYKIQSLKMEKSDIEK